MVCHSQSWTEYLVGPSQCPLKPDFANTGAHERYRPSDHVSLHLIESSMRVLCLHQDALLGVFDVLLHDPLTDWSGTIRKVKGVQNVHAGAAVAEGEEVSLEAESITRTFEEELPQKKVDCETVSAGLPMWFIILNRAAVTTN
jgi:hypothetical protein